MGMKRKTFEVAFLVKQYEVLCLTLPDSDLLKGFCAAVEDVLFATGHYKGFLYTDTKGVVCGLNHPEFNEYRRKYFLKGV